MDDLDLGATIRGFAAGQKIFGRYTLKKILGRGGMGVVWLAHDESLERDLAIKMLPELVANDPAAVRDLKRETNRSQQLSHPHILRIFDFVEGAGLCGITMELVEGGTLTSRRLDQPSEVFPVGQLQPWVRQLCEGLDYAHQRAKVVHRDLKPANLMLTREGELKIADFGIAASVSDSVTRVSKQMGSSGTPLYMSPQQMMGGDPAVTDDIYALGATLYELLAGKPPFHTGNILAQVQTKVPVRVNERRQASGLAGDRVPVAWEETIAACLAKEPKDRPQSAGEVAQKLGLAAPGTKDAEPRVGGGRSVSAASSSRKSRAPLYVMLAAGLVAAATAGWYFGRYAPEQQRLAAERVRQTEIARLEAAKSTEAANQLRTEKEKADIEARRKAEEAQAAAKARTEDEQRAYAVMIVKIDNFTDGSPVSLRPATDAAVKTYLAAVPERYRTEVENRWTTRLSAWEAARLSAARGGIAIRTNPPGAEVRVGAIALDKSPLTLKDQKLGKYSVRVRLEGYEDWSGEIEVKENEFADLNVPLVRTTGALVLAAEPDDVTVDLRSVTAEVAPQHLRTPAKVDLPTGRYELVFHRPRWAERTKTIEIAGKQTTEWKETYPGGAQESAGKYWYVKASLAELQAAAEAGSLAAMLQLGDRYGTGILERVDQRTALKWYKRAADLNDPEAVGIMGSYALSYVVEEAKPGDVLRWTRQAMEAGDPAGIMNWEALFLGHQLLDGQPGMPPEKLQAAFRQILETAEAGSVRGLGQAMYCYERGSGVGKDEQKAVDWGRKAVALGSASSMGILAELLLSRKDDPAARIEAFQLLRRAADLGSPRAMFDLGYLLFVGSKEMPQDKTEAAALWRRSADMGFLPAITALAGLYTSGEGITKDEAAAARLLRRAVDKDYHAAINGLGVAYHNGVGVEKNDAEAVRLWRLGADFHDSFSVHNLGQAYENGWGLPIDHAQAISWWQSAARMGNKLSQDQLTARKLKW